MIASGSIGYGCAEKHPEGTDFYYLGEVTPSEAKDGQIQVDGKSVSIVDMKLTLHKPLTPAMFDYFAAAQEPV